NLHGAAAIVVALAAAGLSGCEEAHSEAAPKPAARPVSYLSLERTNPTREARITGSVETWKKEWVGFEVAGRVRYVLEPGVNVQGRVVDNDGRVVNPGTLIATISNERYELSVEEARARGEVAKRDAEVARIDIEDNIPAQIREAQAELNRSSREFARQKKLAKTGATARMRVDNARADYNAAHARVEQAKARLAEKRSQLAALEARIREANDAVEQAKIDLDDTKLYAPFNGQVSKVHAIAGGYVERGQPVATVQMMDPMQVQIAVSAAVDKQVHYNDVMKVYVDGHDEPLQGWVWKKASVADATTRTFMVTLMVRNRQTEVGLSPALEGKDFHRTDTLWSLESEFDSGKAPFFTNEETLHRDQDGYFVWKAEELTIADLETDFNPAFRVSKVRVEPTERRMRFMQILTYRELSHIGDLDPKLCLLAGKLPDGVEHGDTVVLNRNQWRLRPGQLVQVDLHHGRMQEAFYVPVRAVMKQGSGHHVFVVNDEQNSEEHAAKVEVRPGATVGDYQAIEPIGQAQLKVGTKLIVDGAHYLRDGDFINAFDEVNL
ncbi:MAG: HlyD family secretion protein, partial [Gammaproteobacteria bacterium]